MKQIACSTEKLLLKMVILFLLCIQLNHIFILNNEFFFEIYFSDAVSILEYIIVA
jgi:hypothetical protein